MTTLIPSVEQQRILDAYTSGATTTVKYIDFLMAVETMIHKLRSGLGTQKIAIVCSDKEKQQIICDALKSQGLEPFIYFPQSFSPIEETCINYLRSLNKDDVKLDVITRRSELIKSYSLLETRIKDAYKGLLQPVYKNWSLDEIIYIINSNDLNEKQNILPLKSSTLNPESYLTIKATIKNAQSLYDPMYQIIDAANKLNIKGDLSQISAKSIHEHLSQLRSIRRAFVNKKQEIVEGLASEAENKRKRIQEIGSRILTKAQTISSHTQDSKTGYLSSLFQKTKSTPFADYQKEFLDAIPEDIASVVKIDVASVDTIEKLECFIGDYETAVLQAFSSDPEQQTKTLTRISTLNASDPSILKLNASFSETIQMLNGSGIYSTHFENNAFSFLKQLDYLEEVIKNVATSYTIAYYYPQYLEWNDIVASLSPEIRDIVDMLCEYPKEQWMDVYEKSFLNNIVLQEVQNDAPRSMRNSESALQHKDLLASTYCDQILYDRTHMRTEAIASIKGSKKSLYQTIFKKKLPSTITYVELNQQGRSLVDAYFPIHIHTDVVNSFDDYEMVFNFNENIGSIEGALNFSQFEEVDFKAINHTTCFPLFLNQYSSTEPIQRLSNYEKIRAAKKLAKFLLYITQDIRIYQLKNANIISTLPTYHSGSLQILLEERGAQMIETDDLYDNLTECILETGRTQYLLTKDGLVSPKSETEVLWQQEIIDKYIHAGFQNINVWSADLYTDPTTLDAELREIIGETQPLENTITSGKKTADI